MSIILPYYPLSNSLSVSNVEFTGDLSEPFEVGSTIVFIEIIFTIGLWRFDYMD